MADTTAPVHDRSAERFALVTAAHRFIFSALPFRDPDSRDAAQAFFRAVARACIPTTEIDAILCQVLAVCDRSSGGMLPTMVEQYVHRPRARDRVECFERLIEATIRFRAARDPFVRRAIAEIETHFADQGLRDTLAERLGRQQAALSDDFFRETGTYPSEYLRDVRLQRAAADLTATTRSVKEIWSAIGYNDPSTFDRDFKKKFGMSPRAYRARSIHVRMAATESAPRTPESHVASADARPAAPVRGVVLVVDDDPGTRETIARYLGLERYSVIAVDSGEACLDSTRPLSLIAMLLDYRLPGLDGVECLRQMRERGVDVPAIVFSADWDLEDRHEELAELRATYLSKLCSADDVVAAVAASPKRIGDYLTRTLTSPGP